MMAIFGRGWILWLTLLASCGTTFKAGDRDEDGRGGDSGATGVGAGAGSGSATPHPDNEAGAAGFGGIVEPAGDASAGDSGEGGEGERTDPVCDLPCDDDEECTTTPRGPECRCARAQVRDGSTCRLPRSCNELHVYAPSLPSGPYALKPEGAASSFQSYCGMSQEGGGWTLVVNEGPSFDPMTTGEADALCYSSSCTSIGYSLVRLDSDVMLDVSNSIIAGTTYTARLIVTGVYPMSRGKTLRTLFTTGPNYVEAENNSNLVVRMRDGADCNTLPWDLGKLACLSCDTAGCKEPVLVFGDGDAEPGCRTGAVPHLAIGAANDYATPWSNCAGWPQDPDYGGVDFYPNYIRVWLR